MIIAIITNFAIIFSSTILFYWILSQYKAKRKLSRLENNVLSVIVGLGFGVISFIITILFLDLAHNLLVNTRFIPFLLSGLIGGPIAMIVSAIFIFLIRFILDFSTTASLVISLNALIVGTSLAIFMIYKPITLKSMHIYFSLIMIEISVLLLILNDWSGNFFGHFLIFICYSIALYSFLVYAINYTKELTIQARKSTALNKMDYLTQLSNNLALENELQHYIKEKVPFEMVHLDIDLFKNINILYGYQHGDQIISQLAKTIQQFADERNAYVARIGGDEFCFVMTNCSPAEAIMETYALTKLVESTAFMIHDEKIDITLSASIISYPNNAETLPELFTASNYGLKMLTETSVNKVAHINQIKQQFPNY